mgnify:CR=1 FL=1
MIADIIDGIKPNTKEKQRVVKDIAENTKKKNNGETPTAILLIHSNYLQILGKY